MRMSIFLMHPILFFKTDRWRNIFHTMGYKWFTKPKLVKKENGWDLYIHYDINYEDEEINTFVEFISPHVKGRKQKVYLGYKRPDSENKLNVYLYRNFSACEAKTVTNHV